MFKTIKLSIMCLAAATGLWAQAVSTAQIGGVVEDSAGASVAGAQVRATQTDTGLTRTVTSDAEGRYVITSLPVGRYQVQASREGFATVVQNVILEVNTNPNISFTLRPGAISEQVTVEANVATVETHTVGVGQVIDNQRVVDLPLNGRNVTDLIYLSGGATQAPAADLNTNKNFPTQTISIAGGLSNGATFILDGATHNDTFNNLNLPLPFPDAMQEFKVETSAVPARYGYHSAGAVNVVTKSGSNGLHGDAFEFVRNYAFNARNFFQPARDSLKRNQFGGVAGGRIIKDKLFFFAGYQGTIIRQLPNTTATFTPTQAMLGGDFTAFAACTPGLNLRAPFAGNRLPVSNISPQALNLLKQVPVATDPCGRYNYTLPNNSTQKDAVGKMDYQMSQNSSVFFRYLFGQYENPAFYDGKNALTTTKPGVLNRVNSFALGNTYLFGATTVNAFHLTGNRTLNQRQVPAFFSPTDLGVNMFNLIPSYTSLSVTNAFAVGGATSNPGFFNSTVFQIADDVDLIRGAHQMAFGVNVIHATQHELNNQFSNGQFAFTGQTTGVGLADFLAGSLTTFQQGYQQRDNEVGKYVGLYAQDSWKVRPNLTINAGLRWDPFIPMRHKFGFVSHFNQGSFDRGEKSSVYTNGPAGLSFPGDAGFPGTSTTFGKKANFTPRIGLVWDPTGDGKTSIRSSFGLFSELPHLFFNVRFSNAPPWGASVSTNNTATNGFTNPFATYPGGNPFPAILFGGKNQPFPQFGTFITYGNLHTQPTSVQQWNLSIQRQVGRDWILSANYLGTHTLHLWTAYEANPGVAVPGATAGNINTRRALYLRNPAQGQYYGNVAGLDDGGTATYHAMLLSAQRRVGKGLNVLANYTFSHCIADGFTQEITGPSYVITGNRRADRGNCASDRRHTVNLSLVASMPKLQNRALEMVVGGWQVSSIVRANSGQFVTTTTGVDNALTGVGNQRPVQLLTSVYDANPTVDHYLNRAAFGTPVNGTFGNMSVFNIRTPGSLQMDFGVSRNFRLRELQSIQIRWETFNALNRMNPTFGGLITSLASPLFGRITNATDPRIMQFALKYTF